MTTNEWHNCHFCGELVRDGRDNHGERHWLIDCRPDLVEHEPGALCTWPNDQPPGNCYAYYDHFGLLKWTDQHTHFYAEDAWT